MSFTGKEAAEWREKYIQAFNQMEEGIKELRKRLLQKERQVNREWKQLREEGKVARRAATDALKEFPPCGYFSFAGRHSP